MERDRNLRTKKANAGFSLLELMIVVAVLATLAAVAVPNFLKIVHIARLRGAASDFAGLLQQARIRSVQDDRFYSVYQFAGNGLPEEFVDIYPQALNGASGSGGTAVDPKDPLISFSSEIVQQSVNAAPSTANLKAQLLGSNPSNLTPVDGSAAASPITFGPEGLPCTPFALTGGTVCNSRGGLVAYWVFFQNTSTQDWEAVTVTPAGRIQKWSYAGGVWGKM